MLGPGAQPPSRGRYPPSVSSGDLPARHGGMRRKLIAGNWKMDGLMEPGRALARDLAAKRREQDQLGCDLLICPPAHLLVPVGEEIAGSGISLGAQDCHGAEKGAHTGDISAAMLADAGCSHVIVGHSERRSDHGGGRPGRAGKGRGGAARGLGSHRLRRRDRRPASGRTDTGSRQRAAAGLLADNGGRIRRGLRTGLGDRDGAYADPGRRGRRRISASRGIEMATSAIWKVM